MGYDQLSSDLALNHSSAVILVFFAGIAEGSRIHMGIFATLINPRYASAVDGKVLNALSMYGHRLVVTLEDGVTDGGFGEKIARFFGTSSMKVMSFGAKKEFVNHVMVEEQYFRYHLTPEQIVSDIIEELKL